MISLQLTTNHWPLTIIKSGGEWESNSPQPAEQAATSFEDRGIHRDTFTPKTISYHTSTMSKKQETKDKKFSTSDTGNIAELSFESAYRELEQLVAQMEQGDLPLEQALELHTRGQQLAAHCAQHLDQAELRVKKITSPPA